MHWRKTKQYDDEARPALDAAIRRLREQLDAKYADERDPAEPFEATALDLHDVRVRRRPHYRINRRP